MPIRPDLTPLTSATSALAAGQANLGVVMVYLDCALIHDPYHDAILDVLDEARDALAECRAAQAVFPEEAKRRSRAP